MHTHAAAPITTIIPPARPIGSNPGIVPPWLQGPRRNTNPGIVPPWLQGGPVRPSHPVSDDTPRILAAGVRTVFDPNPIDVDPGIPHILAPR